MKTSHSSTTLTVRDIPAETLERFQAMAKERGCNVRELALWAFERELDRWDFRRTLDQKPVRELGVDAATLIAEARAEREREIT